MSNCPETLRRVGHENDTYESMTKTITSEQEYFDLVKVAESKGIGKSNPIVPQNTKEIKTIEVDLRLLKHKNEIETYDAVHVPYRANYLVADDTPLLNYEIPQTAS